MCPNATDAHHRISIDASVSACISVTEPGSSPRLAREAERARDFEQYATLTTRLVKRVTFLNGSRSYITLLPIYVLPSSLPLLAPPALLSAAGFALLLLPPLSPRREGCSGPLIRRRLALRRCARDAVCAFHCAAPTISRPPHASHVNCTGLLYIAGRSSMRGNSRACSAAAASCPSGAVPSIPAPCTELSACRIAVGASVPARPTYSARAAVRHRRRARSTWTAPTCRGARCPTSRAID